MTWLYAPFATAALLLVGGFTALYAASSGVL